LVLKTDFHFKIKCYLFQSEIKKIKVENENAFIHPVAIMDQLKSTLNPLKIEKFLTDNLVSEISVLIIPGLIKIPGGTTSI